MNLRRTALLMALSLMAMSFAMLQSSGQLWAQPATGPANAAPTTAAPATPTAPVAAEASSPPLPGLDAAGIGLPPGANPFAAANPFANNPFAAAPRTTTNSDNQFAPRSQSEYDRLANTPDIFGDLYLPGPTLQIIDLPDDATIALPPAGGGRIKVAEFNKAITRDRVFVAYNHYHNAAESQGFLGEEFESSFDVDRYMFGLEKTFQDGLFSIELRMPVATSIYFDEEVVTTSSGSIGNLGAIAKVLLFTSNNWSCVAGAGFSLPTGGDTTGTILDSQFRIHNEAVNVMPFAGVMHAGGPFFCHGFSQLDIPLDSNTFDVAGGGLPGVSGNLDGQTLLLLDLVAGVWLYRKPEQRFFSAMAASVECHYTHSFESGDAVQFQRGAQQLTLSTGQPRINFVNLTTGLTVQVTRRAALQVGFTMPLDSQDNRAFDSEVQAAFSSSF